MNPRGFPCWQCGKPAPAGVCLGPHPGYSHAAAINWQMVMNLDGQPVGRTYNGASIDYETLPHRREQKRRYAAQDRFERKVAAQQRLAARIERESAA